jgi:hypothetical protein
VVCPNDVLQPPTYVCRPAADYCDLDDTCDGQNTACPADQRMQAGDPCNKNSAGVYLGTCRAPAGAAAPPPAICCPGPKQGGTVTLNGQGCVILDPASGGLGNVAFVTSGAYAGDIGTPALSNADDTCNKLAAAANLQGGLDKTFRAWLSDGTRTGDAIDRVGNGPFFLVDSSSVASSIADLTDGSIKTPIHLTEWNEDHSQSQYVWTGTDPNGLADANSLCADPKASAPLGFTSAQGNVLGVVGDCTSTGGPNGGLWTATKTSTCNTKLALYCFEGLPPGTVVKPPG